MVIPDAADKLELCVRPDSPPPPPHRFVLVDLYDFPFLYIKYASCLLIILLMLKGRADRQGVGNEWFIFIHRFSVFENRVYRGCFDLKGMEWKE